VIGAYQGAGSGSHARNEMKHQDKDGMITNDDHYGADQAR